MAINQTDSRFLRRIIEVIDQNMSDFEFDVDVLAQKVAVSRRQLFRKVKAIIDTTPKALIRTLRLKRSAQLLLDSEMTITEITFAVGFQDAKHFRTLDSRNNLENCPASLSKKTPYLAIAIVPIDVIFNTDNFKGFHDWPFLVSKIRKELFVYKAYEIR